MIQIAVAIADRKGLNCSKIEAVLMMAVANRKGLANKGKIAMAMAIVDSEGFRW